MRFGSNYLFTLERITLHVALFHILSIEINTFVTRFMFIHIITFWNVANVEDYQTKLVDGCTERSLWRSEIRSPADDVWLTWTLPVPESEARVKQEGNGPLDLWKSPDFVARHRAARSPTRDRRKQKPMEGRSFSRSNERQQRFSQSQSDRRRAQSSVVAAGKAP